MNHGKQQFIRLADKRQRKLKFEKELSVQDKFKVYVREKGCWCTKLILNRLIGFPDFTIFCPNGRIFFIEFKRGKNGKKLELGYLQKKIRKKLIGLGFTFFDCHSLQEAQDCFNGFLYEL